jgi:hypothetical protein
MTQSLATTTPGSRLPRMVMRVWNDPESRSTAIGVTGVLLIHVLLWLISPYVLRMEPVVAGARPHSAAREFNIEMDPETLLKPQPKQPDPTRFVETNPDAPENIPDKTTNFAAQNQQAAQ